QVSVFSVLGDDQLQRIVDAAQATEHPVGETLTEQGVMGHRFHLLVEGAAVVERDGETIARLGPGDFVGELGLLGGGTSTATVRCTEPTHCLSLRREAFWSLLEEEPAIALRILEVVSRRLVDEFRPDHQTNMPRPAG
ncbi:MAG TPA: cyclic nucleotide-binding domain-containing protein, partial [Actinomycetota bacterium]|nr:cyclic nucleotide-binding domain-containing protein [Actinomycetota bacterium]